MADVADLRNLNRKRESADEVSAAGDYELLTVGEVAAMLKVSKSWVYEHTRSRNVPRAERLPHLKVGKYVRFKPRAVRAFIENRWRTTT